MVDLIITMFFHQSDQFVTDFCIVVTDFCTVVTDFCTAFLGLSSLKPTNHSHRIKISNRRATQRCNVSAFFYAKICSLLARRRSSQPVQRVYWPENVIDWLGKWRPTCVMRHARGQKLQSFRRKWPFYMDLYSMSQSSNISMYIINFQKLKNRVALPNRVRCVWTLTPTDVVVQMQ